MVVVEGEVYCSDSDSDDDDVDRFVFLARQPAPAAGRHAEDDRGASSENEDEGGDDDDDDGDAMEDEEDYSERGGAGRKRPLGREILDDAPPPTKKARVGVIAVAPAVALTPPSGSELEVESESAPSPCDVRAGGSGSEGSHGKAAHEHRARRRGGESKNAVKKKRGRGPGCEEDGERGSRLDLTAAAKTAGASPAATSGRFLCNLCERCFESHQALGGHVLGHRKKARIAIAAAASLDDDVGKAGRIGNCKDENGTAVVEVNEETASGIAQGDKTAAVAARRVKDNGPGGGHGKIKTIVADVAEHRKGVDSRGHEHVNGNADLVSKGNAVSGDEFANGNSRTHGKTGIGAAIPNQKVVAGTCHDDGASGDGNVRTTTMYKCKVCGTECLTGRALGGHMRKHRKRPPLGGGGGGEGRSPSPATDDDCQIPLARMFGPEAGLQRQNKIGQV